MPDYTDEQLSELEKPALISEIRRLRRMVDGAEVCGECNGKFLISVPKANSHSAFANKMLCHNPRCVNGVVFPDATVYDREMNPHPEASRPCGGLASLEDAAPRAGRKVKR